MDLIIIEDESIVKPFLHNYLQGVPKILFKTISESRSENQKWA